MRSGGASPYPRRSPRYSRCSTTSLAGGEPHACLPGSAGLRVARPPRQSRPPPPAPSPSAAEPRARTAVLLRCVRLVFHSTPLVLVGTFTILLLLAFRGGLAGLPLLLAVISWFFKYCFVVLDTALAGRNELPVLSVEMLNPFDEQRPLTFAVLVVA